MSPDRYDHARYALYFAPHATAPLGAAASGWFQDPENEAFTVSPRHYGFHATLKPPFALADGRTVEELLTALASFAARQNAFRLPPLRVSELGQFLALTLTEPCASLNRLADSLVEAFDSFRRPPSEEELALRRQAPLTVRQRELLDQWGYPYVFDQWQFHMTLTSSLSDATARAKLLDKLTTHFASALAAPLDLEDLCLFTQPTRQTPFTLSHRFPCSRP